MAPTPSEITDVVKATLQLSEQLMKLGKGYLNLTKSIGSTHREIDDFGRTCLTFSDNLFLFHNEVLETHRQGYAIIQAHQVQALVADVWKLSRTSVRPVKESLRRLQALREEESLTTLVGAKLRWALRDRQSLRKLLINIEPIRLNTLQLAKTFRLHICRSDILRLQADGRDIPDESLSQLTTLIKWNKRLKREGRAACQQFEEQSLANNASTSDTEDFPRHDILIDFVRGVQELTRHEYKTSQDLLAELTWVSLKLPGTVSSLLDLNIDVEKSQRRSKDRTRSRDASRRRRWTEPAKAHPAPSRPRGTVPNTALTSTSSLHVAPLNLSAARGIKDPSAAPPSKAAQPDSQAKSNNLPNHPDNVPAPSTKSSKTSLKATEQPKPSPAAVQERPTAARKSSESSPNKNEPVNEPATSSQNFFQIDANGNFSLDHIPIGNAKSLSTQAQALVHANLTSHNLHADTASQASSSFAPSSLYNVSSGSSVSRKPQDRDRTHDVDVDMDDAASVAASVFSKPASVASWEDWTDSEDEHSADDMQTLYHRDPKRDRKPRDADREDMHTLYHRDSRRRRSSSGGGRKIASEPEVELDREPVSAPAVVSPPVNCSWDAKYGDPKRMAAIVFRRLMEEIRPQ